MTDETGALTMEVSSVRRTPAWRAVTASVRRHPSMMAGAAIFLVMTLGALLAPWLGTGDPQQLSPLNRLKAPSSTAWFGTDMLGRDLYSRVIYGARVSLMVGIAVSLISVVAGTFIGLFSGFLRQIDGVVMRILDGFMAIPPILLAVALMALYGGSLRNVILALSIAEIPRVARLVRGLTLTLREESFVQAAITSGSSLPRIVGRHILPNTIAPLLVQGTYIFAAAMLLESALSFIGAGTPPEIPSWGNIMAEGRVYFLHAPHMILLPGLFLSLTVLAVNLIGDGLRDAIDPRLARQL